jgi:hypothetical protein
MNADEVVMFTLEEDTFDTSVDHSSYVGAMPQARDSLEESVHEEDVALARAITRLEMACEAFDAIDPSAEAAQLSLRKRVGSLALLSEALRNVCGFVHSPSHRELFIRGTGLLEPYLTSVHMWTGDVTETLFHLATELNALAPDWGAFRECMNNVAWIHARAMSEQSRLDRVTDTLPEDLCAALEELFIALARFKNAVEEPFG